MKFTESNGKHCSVSRWLHNCMTFAQATNSNYANPINSNPNPKLKPLEP